VFTRHRLDVLQSVPPGAGVYVQPVKSVHVSGTPHVCGGGVVGTSTHRPLMSHAPSPWHAVAYEQSEPGGRIDDWHWPSVTLHVVPVRHGAMNSGQMV